MTNWEPEQIADLVLTLTGGIVPIGESRHDDKTYENLLCLEEVIDILHDEMQFLLPNLRRYEYSMRRQGEEAKRYFEAASELSKEWVEEYEDES